jgi:hypothetical protein
LIVHAYYSNKPKLQGEGREGEKGERGKRKRGERGEKRTLFF